MWWVVVVVSMNTIQSVFRSRGISALVAVNEGFGEDVLIQSLCSKSSSMARKKQEDGGLSFQGK